LTGNERRGKGERRDATEEEEEETKKTKKKKGQFIV
jgi:hypothetical protein